MSKEFKYDWFFPIRPVLEKWVPHVAKSIVEIGSFEGLSTLWFLEWCQDAELTCVDHFKGGEDQAELDLKFLFSRFAENIKEHSDRVTMLKVDSWDAWLMLCSNRFDVSFVDGSHVAKDVLYDLVNAYRCTKVGGLIVADDYSWENKRSDCPKVAIDAFIRCFVDSIKVEEISRVAVIRKLC